MMMGRKQSVFAAYEGNSMRILVIVGSVMWGKTTSISILTEDRLFPSSEMNRP